MGYRKKFGVVVILCVLLVSSSGTLEAWAQSAQPTAESATTAQGVAAVFANILYVPIKGLVICPVSAGLWAATIVASGGVHYNGATKVVKAGCGGKWIVKGEDIEFAK